MKISCSKITHLKAWPPTVPAIALVLAMALMLSLACRSSVTPTPTETATTFSVQQVLANAAEKFEALESFHFTLDHQGGGTPIAMGLEMEKVVGNAVAPDKLSADIEANIRGLYVEVTTIAIGDSTYLTNPFTQEFEDISIAIKPGGFFDPARGVGAIIREAMEPTVIAETFLGDVPVFHVAGKVASESLRSIFASAVEGIILDAEIWIGMDDFLVRQITLDGRITSDEDDGIFRTLTLSDFDQPFTIEAPVIDSSP